MPDPKKNWEAWEQLAMDHSDKWRLWLNGAVEAAFRQQELTIQG